jgi:hypothetical protein
MKKLIIALSVLLFAASFAENSYSYPGGVAGRTKKTTLLGCGSCHIFGTTVTGSWTTPDTVVAGQTYVFSFLVTKTSSGKIGLDIAAKSGVLALAPSSQYIKVLNGDIVQSSGINLTSVTINFNYTAPSAPGVDTLYATVDAGYAGRWNWAPEKGLVVKTPSGIVNKNITAETYFLNQNYPNPFNPATKIDFSIPKSGYTSLVVYDLNGKKVADLVNENLNPGVYSFEFDASDFSSGVYVYTLQSGNFSQSKKFILLK